MKTLAVVILALTLSLNALAEVQPEPSNKVVIIIDGSGSYKKRRTEAIHKAVDLLDSMAQRKLYRWDTGSDSITIISLDAIPEAIWSGNLTQLKQMPPDFWANRFKGRKDLDGCTNVGEAFHQANDYLEGDSRSISKYLFVFSDLLNEPPTSSVKKCAKPNSMPPSDFPWESFKDVSVSAFWVPADHKLTWQKFIKEHGLEQSFKLHSDTESYEVAIAPPPRPEITMTKADIAKVREQTTQALISIGKWVLIAVSVFIFCLTALIVMAKSLQKRSARSPAFRTRRPARINHLPQ